MGPTSATSIFQIHPTRRCNLRCRHCYSESGPAVAATLGAEVVESALAGAAEAGYDVVGVSGGEPLLYPHLVRVLTAAKALGLLCTVTSNGMLLTERRLSELAGLVDVLAISLDGTPQTHDWVRGDARAFRMLDRRMPAVQASGIPFGFITTLTQHNVHELEFVAQYAAAYGAGLLQVHPLELVGAAVGGMPASVPDQREGTFAFVEAARLAAEYGLAVQVDLVKRSDLLDRPDLFLAEPPAPGAKLGDWLSPLVLETDGTLVPLTYGFPREFSLGDVRRTPVSELAAGWDPEPLRRVCAGVRDRAIESGQVLLSWYDEVLAAAAKQVTR
jgi:Fe-coproporphyrin III synthase